MDNKEKVLSDYIDSLNSERKPKEHDSKTETSEMHELFNTVKLVRSLREPSFPEDGYARKLAYNINKKLLKEKNIKKQKNRWLYGIGSAATAAVLVITLSIAKPFGKTNMVYAMEQAFKGVKAYHGVLEVVETNNEGKSTAQSKLEVWADNKGHYYVKGLEGSQKNLITVNDGQKKWQIQPQEREVDVFSAFPDPYSFTFEIGKEINDVKNAVKTKVIGDGTAAGRAAAVIEVTPQGGSTYKIWIDKETKMPLQKQSSMENSIQYKVQYTNIDFAEKIPKEFLTYNVPSGFKEDKKNSEQVINDLEEAKGIIGFAPRIYENSSSAFTKDNMAVINNKTVKINYSSKDNEKKISVLQKKASDKFKPAAMAVLGRINNNTAEVQSPVQNETGVLQGAASYTGVTGISSVRWQENGFEYAVIGNVSLDELTIFIKGLTKETVEISSPKSQYGNKPKVEVPIDLDVEKGDQKNADAGHSSWKLDPAFAAQVFVSLKISPEGIKGDYPIKYEELKIVENTGKEAAAEVNSSKSPIKRVYMKRLIRQDNTGIWTVVGYDPADK